MRPQVARRRVRGGGGHLPCLAPQQRPEHIQRGRRTRCHLNREAVYSEADSIFQDLEAYLIDVSANIDSMLNC